MAFAPSLFAHLPFRNIGPTSGRIDAVAGVSGDARTYYAGGLGGLFKSADGGVTWKSVFHHKPVSSIGAIAVAPSNSAIVYVGTGEPNLRNDVAFGDGVWKSIDAGATWQHVGLDASGAISRIAVDAANPNLVYAAVLGDVYKPSAMRGVYRSSDGGKTWQRVLYTDDRTGASSIAIDPANPKHLLAGMWEGWRTPYHLNSGGKNDGLYQSFDGGTHWSRMRDSGLPGGTDGRIAVAFAPNDSQRVYALIESTSGTLWRSDDGAKSWKMVNASHGIDQRPFYFTSLTVDPHDANHVYFMSVQMWQSLNGGAKASVIHDTRGGDYHALWIDPSNSKRMIAGDDGGAEVTLDGPAGWLDAGIAVAQSYHVDTDNRVPYTVCSEDQDAGSACGPSNSLADGGIADSDFFSAGGGESGWIVIDRRTPALIYGDGYQGEVTQYDRATQQARVIDVWPQDAMGWPAAPLKYRFQWTSPLAMSPQHPHRLYMGGNRLFVTDDGGDVWNTISPDLTRNDKRFQQFSGGLTRDNTSVEYYDTIFSIGPSAVRDGEIWIGTDDGYVWLTRDNGAHWRNVTPQQLRRDVPGTWARIDAVNPSPFAAGSAYMVADAHKSGDRAPHVYRTTDFGAHWIDISHGLPPDSYARMIRPDPIRRGMLYAGTETGLWLSYDDGAQWMPLRNNLPTVPVYDFTVQRPFDDLVVGTHGRALWIFDDLHPLQEMSAAVAAQPLHLFTLRPAYRWRIGAFTSARWTGANPPYGADISFFLRSATATEPVSVRIYDGSQLVRTIAVKKPVAGINRVWWDLRYTSMHPVKKYVPWGAGGFKGPLVLPGRYRVVVAAARRTAEGMLLVRVDPRSHATMAALRAQLTFLQRIRSDLRTMSATIDRLNALKAKGGPHTPAIAALLARIYEPEVTQAEDALRYPQQVYGQLSYLGSSAASADAAPTRADDVVLARLEARARLLEQQAQSM